MKTALARRKRAAAVRIEPMMLIRVLLVSPADATPR
jgi:hypothetical protein